MTRPLNIIFEDEHIIVLDKPAGLLVIPTPAGERHTLTDLLNDELNRRGLSVKAHPCHRLDRETSGLIIYAKGKSSQQKMMAQFHKHLVRKRYTCFAQGYIKSAKGSWAAISAPLEGKPALTKYRLLKHDLRGFSVLEVEPVTGLTNQIRLHFKHLGHPLVGERRFAFARDFAVKFRRLALHAGYLAFTHPITGKQLEFNSPLPPDMAGFSA